MRQSRCDEASAALISRNRRSRSFIAGMNNMGTPHAAMTASAASNADPGYTKAIAAPVMTRLAP
jgi:hypothetical protein